MLQDLRARVAVGTKAVVVGALAAEITTVIISMTLDAVGHFTKTSMSVKADFFGKQPLVNWKL